MRLSKLAFCFFGLIVLLFSCKKNDSTLNTSPHFYFYNGDTANAARNIILFGKSDTLTVNLYVSSTYSVLKDISVILAPADTYRNIYNSTHGTNYEVMPSAAYTLQTTSTIKNLSSLDTVQIQFYKKQLSSSQQFMLPIQIVNAGGNAIDSNTSIIYFRTTNNTLSGTYNSNIIRINYNGDSSANDVSSIDTLSVQKSLLPDNSLVSELDYADLGSNGWKYFLSTMNDNNQNKFTVSANSVILNSVQAGSFKILASNFNSATKEIYIKSTYINTTGNQRIVEETLTLQ